MKKELRIKWIEYNKYLDLVIEVEKNQQAREIFDDFKRRFMYVLGCNCCETNWKKYKELKKKYLK